MKGDVLRRLQAATMVLLCLFPLGCAGAVRVGHTDEGLASYYSDKLVGNTTASGEVYRADALTAAHRSLPFGTVVKVTNLRNGKYVTVRINDRGPFDDKDRIIDLSRRAAERIGMIRAGVVPVRIEILSVPQPR